MTHEIKFRGKRLDSREWVYGSYIEAEMNTMIAHQIVPYELGEAVREVDPATVGQYTGFKDKNEEKIYEDEILTDRYGSIGVVKWENGQFVVDFGAGDIFEIAECFDEPYEVWSIGNIHDNPELLKEDNNGH